MTTGKKEWSNTNWGKLVMVGLTAVVVSFANNIFTSASNVTKLPALMKNVEYLMAEDVKSKRKNFADSIRLATIKENALRRAEYTKRFDDSLRDDLQDFYHTLYHQNKNYLPKKRSTQRAGTPVRQE